MTCLFGLSVVGRSVAAPGPALETDPAIPMPNKAMATVTKALRYRCACRLATVAGMVLSLVFDLADTTQIPGRGEARIVPLGVLGNGKSRSVWRKNAVRSRSSR